MSSFFLLGKGPDNDLILLSTTPVASRKDALAELSRLTAEPGFDHWDAEVFVLDLETGTPVLLMRPEAPAPAPEPVSDVDEEAGEEVVEPEVAEAADEPILASEAAPEIAAETAEEEPEVDEALAAVIEDLAAEAPEDAAAVEAPEPVVVESPSDLAEGEPEEELETVDEAYAEAVLEAAAEEPSTLKAALERTAAQMAASGITPPDSVGPAEPEDAGVQAPSEPAAPEAAWPWATSGEDEGATFSIAALEEPGVDEGSLVRAAGDDETMAVSRPVILGAYEEPAQAYEEPVAPEAVEPVAELEPETPIEEPAAEEPESDFILDLEQITAATPQQPVGYQAPEAPSQMTCNDCVYVETCPNKDQRDPASCGSFQWK